MTWYPNTDLFLKVNASAVIVPILLLLLALVVIAGFLLCESKLALHTLKFNCKTRCAYLKWNCRFLFSGKQKKKTRAALDM